MSSDTKSFRELIGVTPSTASVKDSTLIIIDTQNEYASGQLKAANVEVTRKVIADLLARYRRAGNVANIVHVVHEIPQGAPAFTQDTPLAAEFDELKPHSGEKLIAKNFPNSFAKTDLHEYLQSLGSIGIKIRSRGIHGAYLCLNYRPGWK